MKIREERLKEVASGVQKQTEKYGFPTKPKKDGKKNNQLLAKMKK